MALHHKLCHTLGGSFDLPHAETHAVLLPHTVGFNAVAVPDLLRPVERIFGSPPGAALYDFAGSLGAPTALRDLGLKEADLDRAAAIAASKPYPESTTVRRGRDPRIAWSGLGRRPARNMTRGRKP